MLLSILIPTISGREAKFNALCERLVEQSQGYSVEILYGKDDKQLSIGEKRNIMLNNCNGKYCVFIDDDDDVSPTYVPKVIAALQDMPDCVGYLESVQIGNKKQVATHSNRFTQWSEH